MYVINCIWYISWYIMIYHISYIWYHIWCAWCIISRTLQWTDIVPSKGKKNMHEDLRDFGMVMQSSCLDTLHDFDTIVHPSCLNILYDFGTIVHSPCLHLYELLHELLHGESTEKARALHDICMTLARLCAKWGYHRAKQRHEEYAQSLHKVCMSCKVCANIVPLWFCPTTLCFVVWNEFPNNRGGG